MVVTIRYDKLGNKRYLKTITREGKILNVPTNLDIIRIKDKKDLDTDYNKVVKMLGKMGR